MTKIHYFKDIGLWLFGILSLAALAVSIPATLAVVSWFHLDGTEAGYWMTYAMITLFELAAVGCILAPLWVDGADTNGIANFLLLLTTGANFIHGMQVFSSQHELPSAVTYIQQTPMLLYIACALYAGIVPLLLKTFLHKFVGRVQRLRGDATDVQKQVAAIVQPAQAMLAAAQMLAVSMDRMQTMQSGHALTNAGAVHTMQPMQLPMQPSYSEQPPTDQETIAWDPNDFSSTLQAVSQLVLPTFEYDDNKYRCVKCRAVQDAPGQGLAKRKASGRWGCPTCKEAK